MRRQVVESLERRKDQMIAALWSNSNWDDDKGTRQSQIEQLEAQYEEVITKVLSRNPPEQEEEIDENNPFFAAAKRGVEKLEEPRNDEGTVKEVIDYSKGIDQ
jgi:hypothetical protein